MDKKEKIPAPPKMNPYVFPVLMLAFGLWCFWDGFLTNDPEMFKHSLFNRVLSIILLPWGIWDFFSTRRKQARKHQENNKLT